MCLDKENWFRFAREKKRTAKRERENGSEFLNANFTYTYTGMAREEDIVSHLLVVFATTLLQNRY